MGPGVFGGALVDDDSSGNLHRLDDPLDDTVEPLRLALAGRKHKAELALFRAGKFPLPESISNERAERHGATAGLRLDVADLAVAIDTLAHTELGSVKVNVLPAQST